MFTNILILGSGGREHALALKLRASPSVGTIYIAPGNSGTTLLGKNLSIDPSNVSEVRQSVRDNDIALVVISDVDTLASGMADMLRAEDILVFGPSKAASRLETARAFAKDFMRRHGVPTARYAVFTDFESAVAYADKESYPLVLKSCIMVSGRAERQTVVVHTKEEGVSAIRRALVDRIQEGIKGPELIIEEYMTGPEIMVRAFCDGAMWRLCPVLVNHRRVHDDDTGLLTTGMGSISPVPFVSQTMLAEIDRDICTPTILGMAAEGMPFVGCLGMTIMLTTTGPKVVDYAVRLGDPETETSLPLLQTDLLKILTATAEGNLTECDIHWNKGACASVVLIVGGYPNPVEAGKSILGIKDASQLPGVTIFHADTKLDHGSVVTSGGRVLVVAAIAETLPEAIANAYEASGKIAFGGMYFRRDIGKAVLGIPLS